MIGDEVTLCLGCKKPRFPFLWSSSFLAALTSTSFYFTNVQLQTNQIKKVLSLIWWPQGKTPLQIYIKGVSVGECASAAASLDPDLEAEAVAGVTLWRLTGAGTVHFSTRRSEARGEGGAGGAEAGAQRRRPTVAHFGHFKTLVTHRDVRTAVAAGERAPVLEAVPDPDGGAEEDHVDADGDH